VVHDNHVYGRELGHQHLLDTGAEGITLHETTITIGAASAPIPQACG
jgi:hypothetical protein